MTTPSAGAPGIPHEPIRGPGNRRLTRHRDDRVVAGVCGGLGRYTDVDPVVYRVLIAVFTFFGGAGLLFYVLAWLFVPEDGDTASAAEGLLRRTDSHGNRVSSRTGTLTTLVLAAVAAFSLLFVVNGHGRLFFLVIGVVIGGLLIWQTTARDRPTTAGGQGYRPPQTPPFAPHGPWPQPADPESTMQSTAAAAPPTTEPVTQQMPVTDDRFTTPLPVRPPDDDRPQWTTKRRRERSVLGRSVIGLALLGLAAVLVLDRVTALDVTAEQVVAGLLALMGLGLLVGAFIGRARWLIVPGLALALALGALNATHRIGDTYSFDVGDQTWAPTTQNALLDRYDGGTGTTTLDLSAVDFAGADRTVRVRAGVGDLRVTVPADTDLVIDAHAGIGDLLLLDRSYDGARRTEHLADEGADGPGGGALHLDLGIGIGDVEVDRAQA